MVADSNFSDAYSPCHVFQYMKYKTKEKATVFTRALDAIDFVGETSERGKYYDHTKILQPAHSYMVAVKTHTIQLLMDINLTGTVKNNKLST